MEGVLRVLLPVLEYPAVEFNQACGGCIPTKMFFGELAARLTDAFGDIGISSQKKKLIADFFGISCLQDKAVLFMLQMAAKV